MKVESYFQRRAEQFDALYRQDSPWRYFLNRLVRRALFERIRLTLEEMAGARDFSVLDVGCGSGRNSALFAAAGARRVVGVDFSERMIEMAREFCRTHGVAERCEFVRADFLEQEFAEKFDFVVALGVFDYVTDARAMLKKMAGLATGKVIGSFPAVSPVRAPLRKLRYAARHCPVYFYTKKELAAIGADAGLADYRLLPCGSAGWVLSGVPVKAQVAERA